MIGQSWKKDARHVSRAGVDAIGGYHVHVSKREFHSARRKERKDRTGLTAAAGSLLNASGVVVASVARAAASRALARSASPPRESSAGACASSARFASAAYGHAVAPDWSAACPTCPTLMANQISASETIAAARIASSRSVAARCSARSACCSATAGDPAASQHSASRSDRRADARVSPPISRHRASCAAGDGAAFLEATSAQQRRRGARDAPRQTPPRRPRTTPARARRVSTRPRARRRRRRARARRRARRAPSRAASAGVIGTRPARSLEPRPRALQRRRRRERAVARARVRGEHRERGRGVFRGRRGRRVGPGAGRGWRVGGWRRAAAFGRAPPPSAPSLAPLAPTPTTRDASQRRCRSACRRVIAGTPVRVPYRRA